MCRNPAGDYLLFLGKCDCWVFHNPAIPQLHNPSCWLSRFPESSQFLFPKIPLAKLQESAQYLFSGFRHFRNRANRKSRKPAKGVVEFMESSIENKREMKVVAMCHQKGGVGKSTATTNLAVAFAKSGLNVAVLDLDPQGTSFSWGERRVAEGNLAVLSVQAVALAKELRRMADAGCHVAIIDTRGAGDAAATAAVNSADLVLIPTLPSFPDVEAIGQTLDMTDRAGKPTFVFLNSCSTHPADKDADQAAAAIVDAGGTVATVRLKDRVAFRRALGDGKGVLEHEPQDEAAMSEIAQLHKFTCEQIGL